MERGVVVVAIVIVAALALLVGFGAFAIQKMKPDWLKINAESRLAKFSMEIGRSGRPEEPRDQPRELEAGRDRPRELEAGPGGSGLPGAADQDNAAALRATVTG